MNNVAINNRLIVDEKGVLASYPVGTLYTNKYNVSPALLFGGTWQQLTADAYIKIVTENGGELGGTNSEHKIPVESIPSHSHEQVASHRNDNTTTYLVEPEEFKAGWWNMVYGGRTKETGGGEPYYPYYYGFFAWVRLNESEVVNNE